MGSKFETYWGNSPVVCPESIIAILRETWKKLIVKDQVNVKTFGYPAGIYLLKIDHWNIRIMCDVCSKLNDVNFEYIWDIALSDAYNAGYEQAGLDKLRARWRACTQRARKEVFACTKLRARKSVKTLFTSTTTLMKLVNYFCVWKQIIFGK